ncbi:hypothetical protein GCM10010124_10530 [Pilimelia terevasa]|uniref:Iron-regulated membrane protein n=1 Tax=Pilimelia terevasa TaxID=53372 RepID=A0A8J3BQ54_9ACTN|nr:PepSY-associated TM helix domain-containing protein [Pilimelia terevasa]GGK19817.1 hypothetical protein GCM10010124_10530 [Pilimelia terevasa]
MPDGTLASVTAGGAPGETTRVAFAVPALTADDLQRTVFVDPYRAQVRGTLDTSFGATPVAAWLSALHKNLHLGDVGRYYSELAASWLWVLVLGGLALWWQRRYGRRTARRLLVPDGRGRGVRRTRGWHATTGVWLSVVLVGLSATGLTWSRHAGARFDAVQEWVGASRPAVATAPSGAATGGAHTGHGGDAAGRTSPAEADTVLAAGRRAGLTGPVQLTPPATPGHAWVFAQTDNVWPVRYDALAVDGATGQVTDRVRWREWPVFAQLSKLGIQGHMGKLFGVANQVLLVLVAAGLVAGICWGYRMWWQRRPAADPRLWRWGRAPRRGAWRGAHPVGLVAAAVAVGAVGWALPVLGVSLLGFLAVDLIRGWRTGQKSDPSSTVSTMSTS